MTYETLQVIVLNTEFLYRYLPSQQKLHIVTKIFATTDRSYQYVINQGVACSARGHCLMRVIAPNSRGVSIAPGRMLFTIIILATRVCWVGTGCCRVFWIEGSVGSHSALCKPARGGTNEFNREGPHYRLGWSGVLFTNRDWLWLATDLQSHALVYEGLCTKLLSYAITSITV